MLRSWRIVKTMHAGTAFDGEGARLYGARWNSPGTALVYTSESQSLAALELLVQLQASQLLRAYSSIWADFEDRLVESLDPRALPADWRAFPAPIALQRIGDQWAAERSSAVLKVPSAIVPDESNFVLNPAHPEFRRVRIGRPRPFPFDRRLR